MDLQFVEKLIGLVESSRLAELEYSADGKRLKLSKAHPSGPSPAATMGVSPPAAERSVAASGAVDGPTAPTAPPAASVAQHRILAGLSGTFFTRPAPGEAPFVQVGDTVQEGQTLAIVEAMKMLNAVEADAGGVVVRVCAEEGEAVSAGAELFVIEVR